MQNLVVCIVLYTIPGEFSREHERFAKDVNFKKLAKSNIRILGSKRESFLVRREFQKKV